MVSGGPGTGKTILALQFLIEGAKNGEPSLLVVYDTGDGELLDHADTLGLELRKYVESGMITVRLTFVGRVRNKEIPIENFTQQLTTALNGYKLTDSSVECAAVL